MNDNSRRTCKRLVGSTGFYYSSVIVEERLGESVAGVGIGRETDGSDRHNC